MQHSGSYETLLEFCDRFLGSALTEVKVTASSLGVPALDRGGSSSPAGSRAGSPAPTSPSRDWKRATAAVISNCQPRTGSPQKRMKRGGGGECRVVAKGTCMVCKEKGVRMTDKKKGLPQTSTHCGHCEAFVHGCGEAGCPNCWEHHAYNKVKGMPNGGDVADGQEL